jgi:hypothetical protein
MKIVARESRPFSERVVEENITDRGEGRAAVAALNGLPQTAMHGRAYRLVEDDYKLIDRLDTLTRH